MNVRHTKCDQNGFYKPLKLLTGIFEESGTMKSAIKLVFISNVQYILIYQNITTSARINILIAQSQKYEDAVF